MNGVINILKPSGMTSHDVVYQVRKKLNIQKVGHTGTLDPNVAGVLPITIGKATKLTQILTDKDKKYRCCMTFGCKTNTSDTYGQIIQKQDTNYYDFENVKDAFNSFIGDIKQTPSMFSAIKVNGQKLYNIARKGETIENIPSRTVTIKSLDIIKRTDESIVFDVVCSKGTYIRTLVEDIAKKMGSIAYMNFLIRIKSGQFCIEDSISLENIEADSIIDIDDIELVGSKSIILNEVMLYRYKNGFTVTTPYIKNFELSEKNIYKIYDENRKLISVANIINDRLKNILML